VTPRPGVCPPPQRAGCTECDPSCSCAAIRERQDLIPALEWFADILPIVLLGIHKPAIPTAKRLLPPLSRKVLAWSNWSPERVGRVDIAAHTQACKVLACPSKRLGCLVPARTWPKYHLRQRASRPLPLPLRTEVTTRLQRPTWHDRQLHGFVALWLSSTGTQAYIQFSDSYGYAA
jgi:hypothetical protein